MVVNFAFVQFVKDGVLAVKSICDFKDFLPRHSSDFKKDAIYEVEWDLADGGQEYFPARILWLAATHADMIAKEKAQKKWKLPKSYIDAVSKPYYTDEVSNGQKVQNATTTSQQVAPVRTTGNNPAKRKSSMETASQKRMKQYLDAASTTESENSDVKPKSRVLREDKPKKDKERDTQEESKETEDKKRPKETEVKKGRREIEDCYLQRLKTIIFNKGRTETENKKVRKETEDKKVRKETEDKKVRKETEDKKVRKETEDKKGTKETEDKKGTKETEDKKGTKESEDKKVTSKSTDKKKDRRHEKGDMAELISETEVIELDEGKEMEKEETIPKINKTEKQIIMKDGKSKEAVRKLFGSDDSDSSDSSTERVVSSKELDKAKAEINQLKLSLKLSGQRRQKLEETCQKLQQENDSLRMESERLNKLCKTLMTQFLDKNEADGAENKDSLAEVKRGDLYSGLQKDPMDKSASDSEKDALDADACEEISDDGDTEDLVLAGKERLGSSSSSPGLQSGSPSFAVRDETTPPPSSSGKTTKRRNSDGENEKLQILLSGPIYRDMMAKKFLPRADDKVHLGEDVYVDYKNWTETIKSSPDENIFIGRLLRAMWGRRTLAKKTLKGGKAKHTKAAGQSEKTALTPKKLNVLMGAIRAFHLKDGTTDEKKLAKAMASGRKVITARLNDDATWLKNHELKEQKQQKLQADKEKLQQEAAEEEQKSPRSLEG